MKPVVSILLAALLVSINLPASAVDSVHVTKLRTATVTKFDAPHGTPGEAVERDKYVPGSWTLAGDPQNGWVQVTEGSKNFWVKNGAIDTDRRIASSADCGAKVAGLADKLAATRALGEECKGK